MSDEILKKILANQEDTTRAVTDLDKKFSLHAQKTELRITSIEKLDDKQNQLLDEHIKGVHTLQRIFEQHEMKDVKRFHEATAPLRWLKTLTKVAGGASAIIGLIYLLMEIF